MLFVQCVLTRIWLEGYLSVYKVWILHYMHLRYPFLDVMNGAKYLFLYKSLVFDCSLCFSYESWTLKRQRRNCIQGKLEKEALKTSWTVWASGGLLNRWQHYNWVVSLLGCLSIAFKYLWLKYSGFDELERWCTIYSCFSYRWETSKLMSCWTILLLV